MKINEKHLKELRSCELYQNMLPRYQKNVEWIIKEYIKFTEEENITTKVYFVTPRKNDSIKIHSPLDVEINRRRLLNLNALDFDFGLQFMSDKFMPFFGDSEIALFNGSRPMSELENGDICLVRTKNGGDHYLVTKEETGFFELDCNYLDSGEGLVLVGTLVNIETR